MTPSTKNGSYAWIIDPDTMMVHLRQVKVGEVLANGIVVKEGVNTGDWIVTAGLHTLTEGQKVTIFGKSEQEVGK